MARGPSDRRPKGAREPADLFDDDVRRYDDLVPGEATPAPPKIGESESTRIAGSPLLALARGPAAPAARDESTRIIGRRDVAAPRLQEESTRIIEPRDLAPPSRPAPEPTRIIAPREAPEATRIIAPRDLPPPGPVRPPPRREATNATRVLRAVADPAHAPAWRPAEVPRASAQPDTLAWEQEEGTVARIVSTAGAALRALRGKRARDGERTATVEIAPALQLPAVPFLQGISEATLDQALAAGAIKIERRGRDALLDGYAAALLVVEGQVALARFPREKLAAEQDAQAKVDPKDKKALKREAKRRVEAGPLIRLAEQNLAFFEKGDLVHLRDAGAPPGLALGLYAVTPVVAISIDRGLLDHLQRAHAFFADRVRRASTAAQKRIEAIGGARAEVADFFIRHGLSVSQVLRVRAIDMCIDCKQCEVACEQRYGAKRLALGGRVLGTLDFVNACHTCTDQRCIDPCAFDAIKYDAAKKEVVIIEAACTGCTLCATACPYAAIEMHDLEDKPLLKLRLEREHKLGFGEQLPPIATPFGPIKPRKAKLKRIASKCDHCIDYADQACISACPTGALFDVEPGDVFAARSADIAAQADDGYDHSRILDVSDLNDPRIFQKGISAGKAQQIEKGRAVRKRIRTGWMWAVGLGAWLLCVVELLLRRLAPQLSVDFLHQTLAEGIDRDIALSRVDFHAGSTFAVRLGYLGSALLFSGLLYPLRRRVPAFKGLGSQRAWFDVHVLTGVIGPLFVALHTASKLDNWITAAVVVMALTSLSGLAGRYLFTQIPEWSSAAGLLASEARGLLDPLRARHPGVRALDNWYEADRRRVAAAAALSPARACAWLVADLLRRVPLRLDLGARVAGLVDPRARREAVRAAMLLGRAERHKVLLPRVEPLFRRWKLVHVPAAIALTLLGGAHIVLALLG